MIHGLELGWGISEWLPIYTAKPNSDILNKMHTTGVAAAAAIPSCLSAGAVCKSSSKF